MTLEDVAKRFDKNTKPFSLDDIFEAARRTRERQAKTISYGKLKQPEQDRDIQKSKQAS